MKNCKKMHPNLWNIYMLFTRNPFVIYMSKELEYYASPSMNLLGLVSLDLTDNDFSAVIMSRDPSMQYRATEVKVSFVSIENARKWVDTEIGRIGKTIHESAELFDLFDVVVSDKQFSNKFKILNEHPSQLAAKQVVQEVGYHYKDIDGNFIQQFQSKNGFDSRFWEIYLYCLFREEGFSFNRNSYAPDYMIEKLDQQIAVEAVIISDTKNDDVSEPLPTSNIELEKRREGIIKKMKHEMPLKYGSALFSKLQKKYWELDHVKGKPLVIAIADFHEFMSMSWSQPALIDFLYGFRYDHKLDDNGDLIVIPKKIESFVKPSGVKIPAGFFNQDEVENISAILVSPTGTIGKFNRMGKQAGLGSDKSRIFRVGTHHDFNPNATVPKMFSYEVTEQNCEKWSEGAALFHNPNAIIPIDPNFFPSFGHYFLDGDFVKSILPDFYPYNSMNRNMMIVDGKDK